ncbi:hypothetical protein Mapa_011772 [Marchantia paleacea]|nr:hypothetical protein Mapa_011772 [Marchantia paleacea]
MEAARPSASRLALCLILCAFVGLQVLVDVTEATPAFPAIITCQSTGASPVFADALLAASQIADLTDQDCCNENCARSVCTTMTSVGTAAVGICTERGQCGGCMPCSEAGTYLKQLVRKCENGGLTAGTYRAILDDNFFLVQLIVFNSKDM